jgi:Tol biopolymer transport system component
MAQLRAMNRALALVAGAFVLFSAPAKQRNRPRSDLWCLPLSGERKPVPFLKTEFFEGQGQFSPDGRWVAYPGESGRTEVYVRPFPPGAGGDKWQISSGGAAHSRWRQDGKELFYISANLKLMAVPVKPGAMFQPGVAQELFQTRIDSVNSDIVFRYDATADGKRFLLSVRLEEVASRSITVVLNWAAGRKP